MNIGDKVKINLTGCISHNKTGRIHSISRTGKYIISFKKYVNGELLDIFYLRNKSTGNDRFKKSELIPLTDDQFKHSTNWANY
jgi:hypothetical protein